MAETFARQGITVITTMRDIEGHNEGAAGELRGLAQSESLPIHVVEIDVVNEASVRKGVAEALRLTGRIDILVNNAGIVVPGPVGLEPVDAFAANIDTNCHGSLRMFRALAPHMQDRGQGQVIQMSSALGRLLDPLLAGYCTSKLAVEAACDAIAIEQRPFGVDVSIIQPAGPYPTQLQANGIHYLNEMLAALPEAERANASRYDELAGNARAR
ncbi:SDR family NAD(P)-dependent oxidoreductase (plasmid) [Qingshengfaniella alkalisoli]|uniref:SDR family NAD(P)-dependent oxidoreductase n=2 Tax=Qingshengfaniella alkalisoli TaxID=2599296 RepID=A0A5B8IW52_9RHOB|nr:SDR family NAD(P)-dependent oxidoreductase [Qingshengfaniella alkalisoli]